MKPDNLDGPCTYSAAQASLGPGHPPASASPVAMIPGLYHQHQLKKSASLHTFTHHATAQFGRVKRKVLSGFWRGKE